MLRKRSLSSGEVDEILPRVEIFLRGVNLRKLVKKGVECVELGKVEAIFFSGYVFVKSDRYVVPALSNSDILTTLPSVWVDRGAVLRIASGADVMRPGITRMDVFNKEQAVVVRDDVYSKPLAVGVALTSSEEARTMGKGRVVKTLHHVDDPVWKLTVNMGYT
jgi:PUA domain protein